MQRWRFAVEQRTIQDFIIKIMHNFVFGWHFQVIKKKNCADENYYVNVLRSNV